MRFRNLNMSRSLIKSKKTSKKSYTLSVFWKNISKKKHKLLSHRLRVSKSHWSYTTRFVKNISISPTNYSRLPISNQKEYTKCISWYSIGINKILSSLALRFTQVTSSIEMINKSLTLNSLSTFSLYTQYFSNQTTKKVNADLPIKISYKCNSMPQLSCLPPRSIAVKKLQTHQLTNINFAYNFLFENQFVQNFHYLQLQNFLV